MNVTLQDRSPSEIVSAFIGSIVSLWSQLFCFFPQTVFHTDPGLFWLETSIHHDIFNRGLQINPDLATPPAAIEGMAKYFQRKRLPFLWHQGASARVYNGHSRAVRYGLTHYETEPVMAVDLLMLNKNVRVAQQLVIQPVTTEEQLLQWIRVWEFGSSEEIFHLWFTCYSGLCFRRESPLHLYLGIVDGSPVATSEVFLDGKVALIGAVNTLASYRHQGIGTALTLKALQTAQEQGYRTGLLTASPMGITIYRRLGFQEYGSYSTYLWHPQHRQS